METIIIKKPIWYNRSVGLSVEKLRGGDVKVEISYKDGDGIIHIKQILKKSCHPPVTLQ